MPIVWTESDTLKLVTLYSKHECLTNPLHPNFKNKLCRYKAYKKITDSMNICGLTVCDSIKRITYVKAQYCYELSKISSAVSCQKFYRPTASWFPIVHQLFFPFVTKDYINDFWKTGRNKVDTFSDYHHKENELSHLTSIELDKPGKDCKCHYVDCRCEKSHTTKSWPRSKSLWTRTECEKTTTDKDRSLYSQKITGIDVGSNCRKDIASLQTQTDSSYFKTKCIACQVCPNVIVKNFASSTLKSNLKDVNVGVDIQTGENRGGKKKIDDEFDMFGKSIAFQLRNIDFETAIKLEKRIQDLIAQERLDNLKPISSECCSSSNCSECKIIRKEMVCSCGLPVIMLKTDQFYELDSKQ